MKRILKCLFFLVALFLLSCSNEEQDRNTEKESLNQVKNNLDLSEFSNINISYNVEVNWENIKRTTKEGFKIIEISAHEKTTSTLKSDFLQEHLKYQIIQIENAGELNSCLVEIYSNKESIDLSWNDYEPK
jgi:hypothetical protein